MQLSKFDVFNTSVQLGLIVETSLGKFGSFRRMGAGEPPPADIKIVRRLTEFTYEVEALTSDGQAFLVLMEEKANELVTHEGGF